MSDLSRDVADLGAIDDTRLRELIRSLEADDLQVSYARRVLHGRIDILRAELVARLRRKHDAGEDVSRPPGSDH